MIRPRPPAKTIPARIRAARERWRSMARGRSARIPDGTPRPVFAERRGMRRPDGPAAAAAPTTSLRATAKALPPVPDAATVALTRMGFGPSPGAVADFQALGASDPARFQAYVEQQIDPASIDDSACDARLASSGFTTTQKTVSQFWTEHALVEEWVITMRPFWEVIQGTWIRAIHSRRQLYELLVGFWHDHF
ncbi:MAG: DUF1800 domain-containing protein, partial [Holophagales bacterium]|nr:DUF1800 domain-containing protein [Holophagales bacterium]